MQKDMNQLITAMKAIQINETSTADDLDKFEACIRKIKTLLKSVSDGVTDVNARNSHLTEEVVTLTTPMTSLSGHSSFAISSPKCKTRSSREIDNKERNETIQCRGTIRLSMLVYLVISIYF